MTQEAVGLYLVPLLESSVRVVVIDGSDPIRFDLLPLSPSLQNEQWLPLVAPERIVR